MSKVKIIAVSDPDKEGKNGGAGSPSYCTDPAYIGKTGEVLGGLMTASIPPILVYAHIRIDDDGDWLFKPEQYQEVAE